MQNLQKFRQFALSADLLSMIKGGLAAPIVVCNCDGNRCTYRGCSDLLSCTEQCAADYGDKCGGCGQVEPPSTSV